MDCIVRKSGPYRRAEFEGRQRITMEGMNAEFIRIRLKRTAETAQSNRHPADAGSDFLESESAARHEGEINP